MIIEYSGGNDGVTTYLEDGAKKDRELHRDDLDSRVILDGNIDLTESIIQSIENNGQERYLRVVISFKENDISTDKIKNIVQDYKDILMSAYSSDEYNFYAEAHMPKIKHVLNKETGELIERKPHVHITIPLTNLATGNYLNPVGLAKNYLQDLDAIQEHLNIKHDSLSPKDNFRNSVDSNPISRIKGDLFNEKNIELKEKIVHEIHDKNIKNIDDFKSLLSTFGQVRIYNKGKDDQYFGVKEAGDNKFTRLKHHYFSKEYIESREPFNKRDTEDYQKIVNKWIKQTSLEIKYVNTSGANSRKEYALLSPNEKLSKLNEIEEKFYERIEQDISRPIRLPDSKRSIKESTKTNSTQSAFKKRLPPLQARRLAYGIQGYRQGQRTNESSPVLQNVYVSNLAKNGEIGQHDDRRMRWTQNARPRIVSSVGQGLYDVKEHKFNTELLSFLKKNVEPERFLSNCVKDFNIKAKDHKVTFGKDGSPRFSVNKRNLNALDFLTKHIHLKPDEAVDYLVKLNEDKLNKEPFNRLDDYRESVPKNEIRGLYKKLDREKNSITWEFQQSLKHIEKKFKDRVKEIKEKDSKKYDVIKSFYLARKLQEIAELKEIKDDGIKMLESNFIHFNSVQGSSMKTVEKLQNLFKSEENGIEAFEEKKKVSYEELNKKHMHYARFESQKISAGRIKDLVIHKNEKKGTVEFLNDETKKLVFIDKGSKVTYKEKDVNKDNVGALMEYAYEKYGGVLKLNGSKEFKTACALACSELGLKVILKPDEYHQMMLADRQVQKEQKEIADIKNDHGQFVLDKAEKEQSSKVEVENTAERGEDVKLETVLNDQEKAEKDQAILDDLLDQNPDQEKAEKDQAILDDLLDQKPDANKQQQLEKDIEEAFIKNLSYDNFKALDDKKVDIKTEMESMIANVDPSMQKRCKEQYNKFSNIYLNSKEIIASDKIKSQLVDSNFDRDNEIVAMAVLATRFTKKMDLKGRHNFSNDKFSMNSFKDKNNEKVDFLLNFDGTKGTMKMGDKTTEFKNTQELSQALDSATVAIKEAQKDNDFDR